MSDNLRRYFAIHEALKQLASQQMNGHQVRHLRTLAALISGIVGSGRVNLPAIASKVPDETQRESRVKRFERFLRNKRITQEIFFMPFARALLCGLPPGPRLLVMDASEAGRGCLALVVSVVLRKRALPLCWLVVKGSKGHLPEEAHKSLLEQAASLVPEGCSVIFLGDGEFDGCSLLAALQERGWEFVCRTAQNAQLREADFPVGSGSFSFTDLPLEPGDLVAIEQVLFTGAFYGPLLAVAAWQPGCREPLYLVSSLELGEEALFWYKKRFLIETLFRDQKSQGFFLHKSHLCDPARVERLLLASCLAYLWLVCLGARLRGNRLWMGRIHRRSRCDLSLFQLGRLWLEECLNQGWRIPVLFQMAKL